MRKPRGRAVLQGELQIKRFVQRREAIQVYGFTRAAVAQDSFEPAANIPRRWCAMMINYSIDHQVLLRRLSWTTALLWGHQTNAHGTIVQSRRKWVKSARNGNSKTKYIECCAWLKILMVYNNCGWTVGEGEMICLSICRWMRMMMIIIVGGRKTNRGLWLLTTSIELSLVLSFVLWRRWWWWWFLLTIYVLWRWSTDLSSAVQPSIMGGDGHWEFCSDHEFDLMPLDSWNVVGSQFWEDSGLWK